MECDEKELSKIMVSISSHNIPIVFKGAMVTNCILENTEYQRLTRDIDGSTDNKDIEDIVFQINNALKMMD